MELTILEGDATALRAGYSCPCGCTPSIEYARGTTVAEEGCCCGNQFAVGPHAAQRLTASAGFRPEQQGFDAPWGERLEAAWLIGPSVHGPGEDHDHEHQSAATIATAIDPMCGMTVEPASAKAMGLHGSYQGIDYFFCGRGCKLEFDDDPQKYLDPSHVPSM